MTKRRGPSPIDQVLRGILREHGLGARTRNDVVFEAWTRAVGPTHAPHAVPVRFNRGTLTVEVDSSPLLQELSSFTGEGYRKAANQALGEARITRVTYKPRGRR